MLCKRLDIVTVCPTDVLLACTVFQVVNGNPKQWQPRIIIRINTCNRITAICLIMTGRYVQLIP